MNESGGKLTVYFDDPFWVGVFERSENKKLSVCKVTFGAEPKDCEVLDFALKNYNRLKFSPNVNITIEKKINNPKRIRREARKQSAPTGIGTKAQIALQLKMEENKQARKTISRKERDEAKERLFELKRQKRKEKHKGR